LWTHLRLDAFSCDVVYFDLSSPTEGSFDSGDGLGGVPFRAFEISGGEGEITEREGIGRSVFLAFVEEIKRGEGGNTDLMTHSRV